MSRASLIRQLSPTDKLALQRLYTEPIVRRHLGGPVSQAEAVAKVAALYEPGKCRRAWAISTEASGQLLLGLVTLARHHDAEELEVSYALLPEHQGNGYATQAVEQVLRYSFTVLGLERVVAETQTSNEASVRLAERLGMKLERTLVRFGQEQSMFVATPVRGVTSVA